MALREVTGMKRFVAATAVSLMMLAPFLWTVDAWARAGRGGSSGSRGSRTYSAPARPQSVAPSPASQASPTASTPATTPDGSGWGGMVGGLIAGGLLGSLLSGGGGRFSYTDLAVLGFVAYLAFRKMRAVQSERASATSPQSFAASSTERALGSREDTPPAWSNPAPTASRRPDPMDDEAQVIRVVTDLFLKVQTAWMARDMEAATAALTPEMRAELQKDCDRMRAQGRINRLDNIAVRSVQVTETWQEPGYNFMTVRVEARLLDYTTDEKTGAVLEGNATEPVTFEEYWTLTRAVWVKAWRLSAIQQPAASSA